MKFNLFEKLRPEIFFLYFSLFFGTLILVITPPFQIPDEVNHFYKAYQISEGKFVSIKEDNRLGGYVPLSLVKVSEKFLFLRWDQKAKTSKQSILEQLNVPLKQDDKVFVDFPNTGLYSCISYAPQAISIFITRSFSLPPLWLFYLARLFAFLFWVLCIYYSIKTIPIYSWLFCLLALLPMSLSINMSLSGDLVTNALAFILIAYIFRFAFSVVRVTITNFLFILFLTVLLALSKVVYTPLILIFLLIPKQKFDSAKSFYVFSTILYSTAFLTVLVWSNIINSLYIPYSDYNLGFRENATIAKDSNMHEQLDFILSHGLYFYDVMRHSLIKAFDMYFDGYIGTFGWLDTELPQWIIWISYIIIFTIAAGNSDPKIALTLKNKGILLFSFLIALVFLLLSQHLTWDYVGCNIITTIQGRYLIPILPVLFMLCYNLKLNFKRYIPLTVIVYSSTALSITVYTLLMRYYS